MKNKNIRKWMLVGIAALMLVLVLIGTAVLLLKDTDTSASRNVDCDIYWNLDRELYLDAAEPGWSARPKDSDGYYHIRFFKEGQILEYKAKDRLLVTNIDSVALMGLELDENGVITAMIPVEDMPVQKLGWLYYVRGVGKSKITLDSAYSLRGISLELPYTEQTVFYDMSGLTNPVGTLTTAQHMDRIYAIGNLDGELTQVYIYSRENVYETVSGHCEHCKSEQVWNKWDKEDSLPTEEGHYILDKDVIVSTQQSISQSASICLDLNGKTIAGEDKVRIYDMGKTGIDLAIMDNSQEKNGAMVSQGEKCGCGTIVQVSYGKLSLYSGTLDASKAVSDITGTAINISDNAVFNMFGGTIIGGTNTWRVEDDKVSITNGIGGSLYVGGTFTMRGGVIRDGKACAKVNSEEDGTHSYQQGYGGNIYVGGDGVFNLIGGEITGGVAENVAGNVAIMGSEAVFNMSGGKITGGVAEGQGQFGGNVYILEGAVFNLTDGEISGGLTYNAGGNVHVNGTMNMFGGLITDGQVLQFGTDRPNENQLSKNLFVVNGHLNMSGGEITGYVNLIDTEKDDDKQAAVTLSGTANISGAAAGYNNLHLSRNGDGIQVNVEQMQSGAKVGITAFGIFSQQTEAANAQYFFSDEQKADVCYVDGCLAIGKYQCVCGKTWHAPYCDTVKHLYELWTAEDSLPTTGGYYVLTRNVTNGSATVRTTDGKTVWNEKLVLDLNGCTITGKAGSRIFDLFESKAGYSDVNSGKISLTVHDSQGNGTIRTPMMTAPSQGTVVWGRDVDSTVKLYGITIDASNLTGTHSGSVIEACGVLDMYDCKLLGNLNDAYADIHIRSTENVTIDNCKMLASVDVYAAGNLTLSGATTVTEMTLLNGQTMKLDRLSAGAKVKVAASGVFYNGTQGQWLVKNGFVQGKTGNDVAVLENGNLAIGRLQCVCGGTKPQGHTCIQVLFGPWLEKESLPVTGGYYYLTEQLRLTGRQDINADDQEIVLDLNGYTVTGLMDQRLYCMYGTGTKLTLTDSSAAKTGTLRSQGTHESQGGVIWARNAATVTVYAGIIDGSAFTTNAALGGAAICVEDTSILNLYGGTVKGGTTTQGGGAAVSVRASAQVTLTNATISGGTNGSAVGHGGAVYVGDDAVFIMNGGLIENGTAIHGANVKLEGKAQFIMNGGQIAEGTVLPDGEWDGTAGALRIDGEAVFTMTGGTICDSEGTKNGRCIFINGDNVRFTMTGGQICGPVWCNAVGTVALSGNPQITESVDGLRLPGNYSAMQLGRLQEDALVYLRLDAVANAKFGNVTDGITGKEIAGQLRIAANDIHTGRVGVYNTDELYAQGAWEDRGGCPCGETIVDGTQLADGTVHRCNWQNWTTVSGDMYGWDFEGGGYFRLKEDVALYSQIGVKANKTVAIDLNGFTMAAKGDSRVFAVHDDTNAAENNNLLIITDSSREKTGTVTSVAAGQGMTEQGAILWAKAYSDRQGQTQILLYGGTLDGSSYETTTHNGASIHIEGGAYMRMYGGNLQGGCANGGYGGVMYVINSAFEMNGGTIQAGSASHGANVAINNSTFTMNGGVIEGGTVLPDGQWNGSGAAVRMDGNSAMIMTGGQIKVVEGTDVGRGIFLNSPNADITMCGGQIDCPIWGNQLGAVHISGSARITDQQIGIRLPAQYNSLVIGKLNEDALIYLCLNGTNAVIGKVEPDVTEDQLVNKLFLAAYYPENGSILLQNSDEVYIAQA